MSDSEYHMVEFRPVGGDVQMVRGRRKTDEELQAEAEAADDIETSAPLQVRIVDDCNAQGGRAILLCDQDGVRLPGQISGSLTQTAERSEITVTFLIDGEEVSLV